MIIIINRDEELNAVVAEAAYFFDKNGLTFNFNHFFNSDAVKVLLRSAYKDFTAKAEKIVANLPEPAQKKGRELLATTHYKEEPYLENVKNSFLCTVNYLFKSLEDFISIDDAITNKFNLTLADDYEGKMLEAISQIAYFLTETLIKEFLDAVSIPKGRNPNIRLHHPKKYP